MRGGREAAERGCLGVPGWDSHRKGMELFEDSQEKNLKEDSLLAEDFSSFDKSLEKNLSFFWAIIIWVCGCGSDLSMRKLRNYRVR